MRMMVLLLLLLASVVLMVLMVVAVNGVFNIYMNRLHELGMHAEPTATTAATRTGCVRVVGEVGAVLVLLALRRPIIVAALVQDVVLIVERYGFRGRQSIEATTTARPVEVRLLNVCRLVHHRMWRMLLLLLLVVLVVVLMVLLLVRIVWMRLGTGGMAAA
uniref:Uncharacterized protein n=1 Tax=Anopheles darlingi TaxID=43151 RepID=A0A2M4DBM4_ANODA